MTEALAAGTPAVAFADCPGVNQLIDHGVNGLVVAAEGDRVANFAATLAELMRDQARRESLGAAGPESVAPFAPEKVYARWEDVLLGRPAPDDPGKPATARTPMIDGTAGTAQRTAPQRISGAER